MHGQCSLQTTCCIICPHTTVLFLNFYDPCKRLLYKAVVQGDPPSWAVSLRPYVLSRIAFTYTWHIGPPSSLWKGIHAVLKTLEGASYVLLSYWSHSCCCLRWKRVKMFSILVNFQGQYVVPIPSFSCACP